MTARRVAPRVAILLVILGVAAVSLRFSWRHKPPLARGDNLWLLSYQITFRADKPGAKLRASFPLDTAHCRVFDRETDAPAMTLERLRPPRAESRDFVAVAKQPGTLQVKADFDLHVSLHGGWRSSPREGKLTAEARAHYLRSEKAVQTDGPAVLRALEQLQTEAVGKAELVDRIFEYCQTEIAPAGRDAPRDAEGALGRKVASPLGRARAMVALCRAAKVPARLVTGFEIKIGADVQPHRWVEVLADEGWVPFDPENGFARELPRNIVPVRRDGVDLVRGTDLTDLRTRFSIVRLPGTAAAQSRRFIDVFDLKQLPLEMHEVLSLILLLPLGALVTSVFRTIIGIRTYGTFTPTLLALSFVYSDWRSGLMVFMVVMAVGLGSRWLLDALQLLVVPRLSVMLTLVVLCLVLSVSFWDYLGTTPGAQAVLLPMVILTMTIERFFLTSEEDGLRFALRLLAGTLVVAFCCYAVLRWKQVGDLILDYPEAHCLTVAALILLGRYSGYRLTELWRFRDLTGGEST